MNDSNVSAHAEVPIDELALVLPLPPSVNHLYATVNGRRVLSRTGRDFKATVTEVITLWQEQQPGSLSFTTLLQRRYLSLTLVFYFVSPLRRDLDGGLKIAQDALCEALGVNDNLVVDVRLTKRVDRQRPRMEVRLAPLPAEHLALDGTVSPPAEKPVGEFVWRSSKASKRRKHQPRSLEELAAKHRWE